MRRAALIAVVALAAIMNGSSAVVAQSSCFGPSCQANLTVLPLTTFVTKPAGVIYKGSTAWLHDFNYGANGTVTTDGYNFFAGGAGNFTMGSTATSPSHSSRNIGIGAGVLSSNTKGAENVAAGYSALESNTTGSYNVALGYQALQVNTTGLSNTAIGYRALGSSVLGDANVAVGSYGLLELIPSDSVGGNTAIGFGTGRGIVTGTRNTIIGANVGLYTYLPATLSENIIIANGYGDRGIRARAVPPFSLTDNTITTFAVLTLGNDTGGGGSFDYCVYAADATTGGIECGRVDFAGIDVTAGAGGEVCPTPTKVGTPIQALSGSTLNVTFAASTGTDLCNIRVTADTNIATPVALNITWWAVNSGRTLTPQ